MGAGTAADTANIEVGSVRVGGKYHSACMVDDAVARIRGNLVKELVDGGEGGFGDSCFLGSDFAEFHQQFVVDRSCIMEEGPDKFLYAADSEFVERRSGVRFISILVFCAVFDGLEFVQG